MMRRHRRSISKLRRRSTDMKPETIAIMYLAIAAICWLAAVWFYRQRNKAKAEAYYWEQIATAARAMLHDASMGVESANRTLMRVNECVVWPISGRWPITKGRS